MMRLPIVGVFQSMGKLILNDEIIQIHNDSIEIRFKSDVAPTLFQDCRIVSLSISERWTRPIKRGDHRPI